MSPEINCGHPGHLPNGWLENIEQGTALGSSIIFRCFANMTIEGDQSTVCQADGTWSKPLPKCLGESLDPRPRIQLSAGQSLDRFLFVACEQVAGSQVTGDESGQREMESESMNE